MKLVEINIVNLIILVDFAKIISCVGKNDTQ